MLGHTCQLKSTAVTMTTTTGFMILLLVAPVPHCKFDLYVGRWKRHLGLVYLTFLQAARSKMQGAPMS